MNKRFIYSLSRTLLLTITFGQIAFAQSHFSKVFETEYGESSLVNAFEVVNDKVLLITSHICSDSNLACTQIRYLDLEGEVLKQMVIPEFNSGNECVLHFRGNEILISGHELTWPGPTLNVVTISNEFDIIQRRSYVPLNSHNISNEGVLYLDGYYYFYGDTRKLNDFQVKGYISKMPSSLDSIIGTYIFDLESAENHVYDLQLTPENNLAFISIGENLNDHDNQIRIYEIDTSGKLLNTYNQAFRPNSAVDGDLDIMDNGDYVFVSNNDEISWSYQVNYVYSETNTLKWTTVLPFDLFDLESKIRKYNIRDIKITKNGDIIGCGQVCDDDSEGERYETGILFRLNSETGELLWQRSYNLPNTDFPNEGIDKYKHSMLLATEELDNGDILSMGYVVKEDSLGFFDGFDLWVLTTDENGCIPKYNCDELVITSINEIQSKVQTLPVYPNPTTHYLHFDPDLSFDKVKIYNLKGQEFEPIFNHSHMLDCSLLPQGQYSIHYWHQSNLVGNSCFIKL